MCLYRDGTVGEGREAIVSRRPAQGQPIGALLRHSQTRDALWETFEVRENTLGYVRSCSNIKYE